ncbi:hypothetical protein BDP27DRAFT_483535 [Rhodocollybia butyracea]|uniref:Uncharacterized protein n=1 Tax=Rhodocollybia butyracea TaxID=206335 RepID=A0A9P5QAE7_9AGAR|nr:hypothetical protein BDP27DRAFT_483535 [Rhodocollybia butyracea]
MKHISKPFILLALILCSLVDISRSELTICSVPLRYENHATSGCNRATKAFTTKRGHLQKITKVIGDEGPPGTECDNTLELQLLAEAANTSGACKSFWMLRSGDLIDTDVHSYWEQVVYAANAFPNTYYLDKATNRAKGKAVTNFLSGEELGDKTLLHNIQMYLSDVHKEVKSVSETLDIGLQAALNNMQLAAQAKINMMPSKTERDQSNRDAKQRILNDAKALFGFYALFPNPTTISQLFQGFEEYIEEHTNSKEIIHVNIPTKSRSTYVHNHQHPLVQHH